MRIAEFCIKHKVTTILSFIMVVIFGLMTFGSLPLALMPSIDLPMAIVTTTYVGAGPEEIENLVTKPLEEACARVAGMDTLQSRSQENASLVMVTFADGTDMDEALVDLREKVDLAKSTLPDDASAPTVMKMDVDAMPVVVIGLKGADLAQLQSIAQDDVSPVLERIDGVASVSITGGYENEVSVDTYADRMHGYGLSVAYLAQMLGADNVAMPAGEVDNGSHTLSVRTDGEYKSVDDVANTLIPLPKGGTVRLGEVAKVSMQPKKQTAIAKVDGAPCVMLSVSKQSGVNTVQVANRVKDAMADLTQDNPTLSWNLVLDQSEYINQTVESVIQNIVLGVVLAALVLLVFLRDFGATAVISVSMPVCIISVFLIMRALNITMNMMSLGGMAMGVGMIVDNSIVVLENIFRFRSDGYSRWDACTKGAAEVSLAISASTLTTVAVFLPIGLSGGMAGMMFKEFCITIVALLMASLVIALTLVPLLCYMTMDRGRRRLRVPNTTGDLVDRPLMRRYKSVLRFLLTRRSVAVIVSFAMIAVFIVSIFAAGVELIPETDQGEISISVSMPVGAEMEETARIEDRITGIIQKTVPELDSLYYSTSSMSPFGGSGAGVTVQLVDLAKRERTAMQVADSLRRDLADIAGCELSVSTASTMSMSSTGSPIDIELSGDDYTALTRAGDDLVERISALPDAVEVKSSAADEVPRVNVSINRANATRFGLTAATIGAAVRGSLNGSTATTLKIAGDEYDITVRGDETSKASLDALKAVAIPTQTGGTVPLSLVADVKTELAPQMITRMNQSRTITVTGDSLSGNTVELNKAVSQIMSEYELPDGVRSETGGEMKDMAESFTTLGMALIVALGLVYFVLASQFESFVLPVIIMMILPIGLLGAMFGLPITGNKISMVSLLAVIILAGTVVNSSIVLIDYIQTRRGRGEDKDTAILNACPRRVRPVLMTTLTTILGLVPMAMSHSEGAELMRPMAVVMIAGMVISTIVTLLFTPVYYSLVDSLTSRFHKKHPPQDPKQDIPGYVPEKGEESLV